MENPSYIITLRNPQNPSQSCTDVLRLIVEIAADLSVNYGEDGIETASFVLSQFVTPHVEDLAKTLLTLRIQELMSDKAD